MNRRLLHYIRRAAGSLSFGAACVLVSVGAAVLQPLIIANAVNALAVGATTAAARHALLYVGAAGVEALFLYLQIVNILGAARRIEFEMRNDFYAHLQRLPVEYLQRQRTGDLTMRTTEDITAVRLIVPSVMYSLRSLAFIVAAFSLMERVDLTLALICLSALPLIGVAAKYFTRQIHDRQKHVQDSLGLLAARVRENITGIHVVRAFGAEANEERMFGSRSEALLNANYSVTDASAAFDPAVRTLMAGLFAAIFALGGARVLDGTLSLGAFISFQLYLVNIGSRVLILTAVANLFQRCMASMRRLDHVWSLEEPIPAVAAAPSRTLHGELQVRNLTYAYPGRIPGGGAPGGDAVLRAIDLGVPVGQTLGIVGATGSGKSTLLALIARAYKAPHGSIFIDKTAIEQIPLNDLRAAIGMVPQEPFLFSDSVVENIRFGKSDATDQEVTAVMRVAALDSESFLLRTALANAAAEAGPALSGGQKQRVALARALIRNPVILLLDDAFSSVDATTEEKILERVRSARQHKTTVIVSHRISAVRHADQIVFLEHGRIIERGKHAALMQLDGCYAELQRRQSLVAEIANFS